MSSLEAEKGLIPSLGFAQIPCLGMGTVRLYGEECVSAVGHALDIGYRYIDTAQRYDNEAEVGVALSRSGVDRDQIFLTTKLDFPHYSRQELEPSVRASLDRLEVDYVDLLLIHWPHETVPMEETLEAMRAVQEEGLIRFIGVSNFTAPHLLRATEHAPISANQVEYHPYLSQESLLATHRHLEVPLVAYSPLARGEILDDPVLAAIADAHEKSVAQVALRWVVQQAGVGAVVRSSAAEHREANFDIFDFELSSSEMRSIFELEKGHRIIDPPFAPEWDPEGERT